MTLALLSVAFGDNFAASGSCLRTILDLIRLDPGRVAGGLTAALLYVGAYTLLPLVVVRPLFDSVLAAADLAALPPILFAAGLLVLVNAGAQLMQDGLLGSAGGRIASLARLRAFRALVDSPVGGRDRAGSGGLAGRIVADSAEVFNFIARDLAGLLVQILLITVILGYLIYLSPSLTVVVLVAGVLQALLMGWVGRRIRATSEAAQADVQEIAGVVQEALGQPHSVKAYGLEDRVLAAAGAPERTYRHRVATRAWIGALQNPANQLMLGAAVIILLYLAVREAGAGGTTIGELTAYFSYLAMLAPPVQILGGAWAAFSRALAGADRLRALAGTEAERESGDLSGAPWRGEVVFEGVSFTYPGDPDPVLAGIDLKLAEGQTIAVVGPSGAGKTTLANLILRFHEPDTGRILYGGVDIRRFKLQAWRSRIALVPQEVILLRTTIRENVALARPAASPAEIVEALRRAQILDVVEALPDGLDTVLGERGGGLSMGQRQRIAIARAILRDPAILILDEATSALDPESERAVNAALAELTRGRTTLVIAHRLSTVRTADRIVVLHEGRVVEQGRHGELLATGGLYARLHSEG